MKHSLKILTAIFVSVFLISFSLPAKKQKIEGSWRKLSTTTNGIIIPQGPINRIQVFKSDKTFETRLITPETSRKTNGGLYTIINDTTMVTMHTDQMGRISPLTNKYNFTIKNDTMHFYGFFISGQAIHGGTLTSYYIDELWIREK